LTVGSQVKSCYSSIKSVEAGLSLLASKTQDAETQNKFNEAQKIVTTVKEELKQQVTQLAKQEPQYK
jgi:hypothetical protein